MNDRAFQRPGRFDSQEEATVAAYQNIVVAAYLDCTGLVIQRGGMVGWAFSTNRGDSWTDPGSQVPLPKVYNTDPGSSADPALDVDANGNFYLVASYVLSDQSIALAVYRGSYNPVSQGIVWNTPSLAPYGDRPSIAINRVTGHIYIASAAYGISVVRSTDAGNSWEQPVSLSTDLMDNEPTVRVGPDGEVYIAWLTNHQDYPKQLMVRKSAQGQWPNFTPKTVVATVQRIQPSAHGATNTPYTSMAIVSSGPARGRVYLVWTDGQFDSNPGPYGGFSAIAFSYLSNGTWSAPTMVNDDGNPSDTQTHHWQPWASSAPDGTVYVGWYDRRLRSVGCTVLPCDFRTDVYAASFTANGGVSPNVRLTDQTFSMDVPSETDCHPAHFGEYNGAFATSDRFYFVWGDGRKGDPDAFAGGLFLP